MKTKSEAMLEENQTTDPVCGMIVDNAFDELSYEYNGSEYQFCSRHCLQKFRSNPRQYIGDGSIPKKQSEKQPASSKGADYTCPMHPEVQQDRSGDCPKCGMALEPRTPVAAESKTEWTCPMHPEVVSDKPGDCPKCGMALEPRSVGSEEEENKEYIYMRNRFWVGAVLSLPLVLIAMRDILGLGFLETIAGPGILHWSEFVLATPVVLWGGWIFYMRAWKSVATWNLNMFTLIGLGTAVAYIYSVVALFFPEFFRLRSEAIAARWEFILKLRR